MDLDDDAVDADRGSDLNAHVGRKVEPRGIQCPGKQYVGLPLTDQPIAPAIPAGKDDGHYTIIFSLLRTSSVEIIRGTQMK